MKLYKYKSLANLWHFLDLVLNQRLYCAHWADLNDPLEGRYEIYLNSQSSKIKRTAVDRIETAKNTYRVASLSADPANFLLWSHYADGHKGVAIEIDIPESHPDLVEILYSGFSPVFTGKTQTKKDMRSLFNGKGEEWSYEREYRIIVTKEFFKLPFPISRVLLGPRVNRHQEKILSTLLPKSVKLVRTQLDHAQGTLVVNRYNNSLASSTHQAAAAK